MEGRTELDMRGVQGTISMCQDAWDFVDEIRKEQAVLPQKGKGRIIEDFLLKEKARRDKKKSSELTEQKSA